MDSSQRVLGVPSCVLKQRHSHRVENRTPSHISAQLAASGFLGGHPGDWMKVQAKGGDRAELYIYEEIGFDWMAEDGVTSKSFAKQLASLGNVETIDLYLNSPGGDVFDALAIHSQLKRHPAKVNVIIDGLAASAASFVAMAGDTVTMAEGALMMIHDAWGLFIGNAEEGARFVESLEKIDAEIAGLYSGRSGRDAQEFRALMDAETWLDGNEAVELGLADSVVVDRKRKYEGRFADLTALAELLK